MRRFIKTLIGFALVAGAFLPEAQAARRATPQNLCTMDENGRQYNCHPFFGAPSITDEFQKIRKKRKSGKSKASSSSYASSGGLTRIQCGPARTLVNAAYAGKFSAFCTEAYARHKFKWANGADRRGGRCSTSNKHPCGYALDVAQTCRSRGPGHCLPSNFPMASIDALAAKHGLASGCAWRNRDCGHFEVPGSLASILKRKPKDEPVQVASADPAEPLVEKLQFPVAYREITKTYHSEHPDPMPSVPYDLGLAPVGEQRVMTTLAYYAYNEYLPAGPKPIDVVKAELRGIPVGTAAEEIRRASVISGIPLPALMAFAKIESSFNCRNVTGSYAGLFQLSHPKSKNRQNEFGRYGPKNGDVMDCRDNALATVNKFLTEIADVEHALGREVTPEVIYCVHQQGLGGCIQHLLRPDRVAWQSMCASTDGKEKGPAWCRKAIWGNYPAAEKRKIRSVEHLTSGAFMGFWMQKARQLTASFKDPKKFALASAAPKQKEASSAKRKKYAYSKKSKKRYVKRHRYKHRVHFAQR